MHRGIRNVMADKLDYIHRFPAFDGDSDNSQVVMFTAAAGGFDIQISADDTHIKNYIIQKPGTVTNELKKAWKVVTVPGFKSVIEFIFFLFRPRFAAEPR